jgi:putative hemolysin
MEMKNLFIEILILMLLIVLNAFFAASEIALISLNDNKIKLMAEEGNKKAILLKNLLGEPSRFLATIQIGITLAGFLASAFAAETFAVRFVDVIKNTGISISDMWLKHISVVIITIALSYFTLVLGELVPKRLAMKKAESISMFVSSPLTLLSIITAPFVRFLTFSTNFIVRLFGVDPNAEDERVTEEEILMMVDVGKEKGTIHETEKQMINNIFKFDNKKVSEIMTHRTDIAALDISSTIDDVVSFINSEKYSRIPVYEDNIDNIIGVMHAKYLIEYLARECSRKDFSLRNMVKPPFFVPSFKRTDELFKEIKHNKNHMAVIIDEYGGTAGIVTLEDLIEQIVGNIFDEDDEVENDIVKVDESTFVIKGTISLEDVSDFLGVEFPVEQYKTLSGFLIGQIGRIPGKNDDTKVEFNGLVFKVEESDDKIVSKVRVCRY